MRKALQVGSVVLPLDGFGVTLHLLAGQGVDGEALGGDADDVVVFEVHDLVRQPQKSRHVAGQEHFAVPDSEHHGRAASCRHQLVRVAGVHHHQPVGARHLSQGLFDGMHEVALVGVVDEVGHDFRIRLGGEVVAAACAVARTGSGSSR